MISEGGYVNNPKDPGGETKYGICKKHNPNIDIKDITLEFAKEYYRKNFWSPLYEKIEDRKIALKLFDISVNIGKEKIKDLINKTLMDAYCYPDSNLVSQLLQVIDMDKTLYTSKIWEDFVAKIINKMDSDVFLAVFTYNLVDYYCSIVYRNDSLVVFRRGWIKRAIR